MENLERLRETAIWDVVIIGGGATGLGSAVDAAARGYRTLLLEALDFAHGTSSRSTKLIHGGVRYLAQGNIALVREALRERGSAACAMHPTWSIAATSWCRRTAGIDLPYYGIGLKFYDLLAGSAPPRRIALDRTGGCDGSHPDDPRPEGCTAESSTPTGSLTTPGWRSRWRGRLPTWGAPPSTIWPVKGFIKRAGRIAGIDGARYGDRRGPGDLEARAVINAAGVYVDALRRLDDARIPRRS